MTKEIYSLSIVPPEPIYGKFKGIIDYLSDKHGAPKFKPHITIICEIHKSEAEMMEKCDQLAKQIKPFKVKLKGLDFSGSYYRCVFLLAEKSEGIVGINQKVRDVFGLDPDPDYMPHISLMYGDYGDDEKEHFIDEIKKMGTDLDIEFIVDGFWLDHAADDIPIEQWEKVQEYKLSG